MVYLYNQKCQNFYMKKKSKILDKNTMSLDTKESLSLATP